MENSSQNKMYRFMPFVLLSMVLLTSCSSYQPSSYYDNDGIYGTRNQNTTPRYSQNNTQTQPSQNKYQNYFKEKSDQIEYMQNETDQIFTDIDSYSSTSVNDSIDVTQNYDYNYNDNNPGWGDNPDSVVLNVYSNGWG